jgi:hypothetical protein
VSELEIEGRHPDLGKMLVDMQTVPKMHQRPRLVDKRQYFSRVRVAWTMWIRGQCQSFFAQIPNGVIHAHADF